MAGAVVPRVQAIATLKYELRKDGTGGSISITRGVTSIEGADREALLAALAAFDSFDLNDGPHGGRDFGDLTMWNTELLLKLDYNAPGLCFGSNDPADPAVTHRVLTIMLPEEW